MKLLSLKKITLIFLGFFIISISFAQKENTSLKLPVYKITSSTTIIYLMGTTHVGKKEFYPLAPVILKALSKSKELILEVILTKEQIQKLQTQIMADAFYPNGASLETVLSEETYKKLTVFLKNFNLPIALVKNYRPFYLYLMLSSLDLQNQGYVAYYGVENYLTRISASLAIKKTQLENANFQYKLLKSMSLIGDAETFIKYILAHFYKSQRKSEKLFLFWKQGEFEKLKELVKEEFKITPGFQAVYQKLVAERDKNMALKIKNYLENKEGQYFVAVGAAHVLGILELLKQEGSYTIIQLVK